MNVANVWAHVYISQKKKSQKFQKVTKFFDFFSLKIGFHTALLFMILC